MCCANRYVSQPQLTEICLRKQWDSNCVRGTTIEHLWREEAAAHDLAQRRVFQVGEARSVLGLGQEEIPQTCCLQPIHTQDDALSEDGPIGLFRIGPFIYSNK